MEISLSDDDIRRLANKMCLVDSIIDSFCAIQRQKFKNHDKKYYFIEAKISKHISDISLEESIKFMKTIDLKSNDIVFIFLYCNQHFSLLCFRPKAKKNKFIHLDSIKGKNCKYAKDFTIRLCQMYKIKLTNDIFFEYECTQQDNQYDCLLYAISFANYISTFNVFHKEMNKVITPRYIDYVRTKLQECKSVPAFENISESPIEIPTVKPNIVIDQS